MRIAAVVFMIIFATFIPYSECAKILGVFHFNGKSHFIVFEALMKALAARGHQVVVVSHFPQKNPVLNYTDIDVSGTVPNVVDNVTIDMARTWNCVRNIDALWTLTVDACRRVMNHPNAQKLLHSTEEFDLVITEIFGSECTIGYAWKFKAPLVNIISSVSFPWANTRIGNIDNPAYIPNYYLPYTDKMDFWQRLTNTMFNVMFNIKNILNGNNPSTSLMREHFGRDVPSVEELAMNASLVLVNSHFSINWPRPAVPAFVEVGGLHLKKPKKLPQNLQKFFDDSPHGVIYFNLGTLVQVQSFPPEKLKALVDAFGELSERVLMKYTGITLPGKPENVMISKWIPQLDVLHHPKTKLFISHGGLGGTHETVYAGVPVVGIPMFGDQESNINNLRELGMAMMLKYEEITKESLLSAIRTVIDTHSYSESAKRVSARFRDRPMSALDTAVYWVEYVIRHRGAPHLRSAATDMPLYQYLLLDVIAFLLLVVSTCAYILYYALEIALRTLTNTKSTAQHKRVKQE